MSSTYPVLRALRHLPLRALSAAVILLGAGVADRPPDPPGRPDRPRPHRRPAVGRRGGRVLGAALAGPGDLDGPVGRPPRRRLPARPRASRPGPTSASTPRRVDARQGRPAAPRRPAPPGAAASGAARSADGRSRSPATPCRWCGPAGCRSRTRCGPPARRSRCGSVAPARASPGRWPATPSTPPARCSSRPRAPTCSTTPATPAPPGAGSTCSTRPAWATCRPRSAGRRWPAARTTRPRCAAPRDLIPIAGAPRDAERWDEQARSLLTTLLHAAALSGGTMRTVLGWISPADVDRPRRDPRRAAPPAPQPRQRRRTPVRAAYGRWSTRSAPCTAPTTAP